MCKSMLNVCLEGSYKDCEESLFDIVIELSRKRIHARLQSSKWEKPRHLRGIQKEPLTERLLASSKRVLTVSRVPSTENRLQDIACNVQALHKLYLDMERATHDDDTYYLKQIVRQASGLSAPGTSLEATLIANGISPAVANSSMIRRVDKLGRYWGACTTMAKLASNAKYRTIFESIQLEPIRSHRVHIWPPGSKEKRHVHAEVQLVTHHRMHPSNPPPRVIGISKAACYLCDLFLSKHRQYYYSGTHGTIFDAWTVPDLVEYTVSDLADLRQIVAAMNRELVDATQRMRKPVTKRQKAPKAAAYQSYIWSDPYQASTPPLSMRDDQSLSASPRTLTPGSAGPYVRTTPSPRQTDEYDGAAIENLSIQPASVKTHNIATSARSSHGTIKPEGTELRAYTLTSPPKDGRKEKAETDRSAEHLPLPNDRNAPTIAPPSCGSITAEAIEPIAHTPMSPQPRSCDEIRYTSSTTPRTSQGTGLNLANAANASHETITPKKAVTRAFTAPTSPVISRDELGNTDRPTMQVEQEGNDINTPAMERQDTAIAEASATTPISSHAAAYSDIILSSTTQPQRRSLTPAKTLFAASPGIHLYFELEAHSSKLSSNATITLDRTPHSTFPHAGIASTFVDVAAMTPGEEVAVGERTIGEGPVEMLLRNGGGAGLRVVCEWAG